MAILHARYPIEWCLLQALYRHRERYFLVAPLVNRRIRASEKYIIFSIKNLINSLFAFIFVFVTRRLHLNSSMFCLFSWWLSLFRNRLFIRFLSCFRLIDFHVFIFRFNLFWFDLLCRLFFLRLSLLCFSLFAEEWINFLIRFAFLNFFLYRRLILSFFLDSRWLGFYFWKGFCNSFFRDLLNYFAEMFSKSHSMLYLFLKNVLWRILNLNRVFSGFLRFSNITVGFSDPVTCWYNSSDIIFKFKV